MKLTAYVSHSIRGECGAKATDEQMQANCRAAAEFAAKVRARFPNIEFYVPGECDEFVQKAYRMGVLTERQILDVDFELIRDRDFMLLFAPDGFLSSGMLEEWLFAQRADKPYILMRSAEWEDLCRMERWLLQSGLGRGGDV